MVYTADLPTTRTIITGKSEDNTVIFATHEDPEREPNILQNHLGYLKAWLKHGKLKSLKVKQSK